MKWLLVGATGQIGQALCQTMVRAGHDLTVLVRTTTDLTFPDGVKVQRADSFNARAFADALNGVDGVIYGVGLPEQFVFDTGVFARVNLDLFRLFLSELEKTPVRRLVYISTYEVFQTVDGRIRETHSPADPSGQTPYFQAMINAHALARSESLRLGLQLTTVHPAAVYGGRNTGDGITNYLENLVNRDHLRMPANVAGRFPVVHAASLSDAIVLALGHTGAFLVSEGMTSMPELARALRCQTRSLVPLTLPGPLAYLGATLLEGVAYLTRRRPILARVQVKFITQGSEPLAEKARAELGWQPMTLDQGLARYLRERVGHP
jgi:nucleoside-diphosphate-sugar epimerase